MNYDEYVAQRELNLDTPDFQEKFDELRRDYEEKRKYLEEINRQLKEALFTSELKHSPEDKPKNYFVSYLSFTAGLFGFVSVLVFEDDILQKFVQNIGLKGTSSLIIISGLILGLSVLGFYWSIIGKSDNSDRHLYADRPAFKSQMDKLSQLFDEKLESVSELEHTIQAISDEEKSQLTKIAKEKIESVATEEYAKDFLSKMKNDIERDLFKGKMFDFYNIASGRIYNVINSISIRGNMNLFFGTGAALLGIGFLGYFIIYIDKPPANGENPLDTAIAQFLNFSPRLALVILIEVFAYFFLRLYKTSLEEIKYFQNEITNIEMKFVAALAALGMNENDTINKILLSFTSTERNFVLKNGESTVDIEKAKIDGDSFREVVSMISGNFGLKEKK